MNKNHKIVERKSIFLCNPEKHPDCPGKAKENWCGVECFCTTDIKKSVDNHALTQEEFNKHYDLRHPAVDVPMPDLEGE